MEESASQGDPKTKVVNDNTSHWCDEHNAWVKHKPEECNLHKERNTKAQDKGDKGAGDNNKPSSAFAKTLTTIWEDIERESRSS